MKYLPCIIVGLLIFSSLAVIGVGNEAGDIQPKVMMDNIKAINKEIPRQTALAGNVLISDNDRDDFHPRMTANTQGDIVVVYEQGLGIFSKQVPVVYSADDGDTWTFQFVFDSIDFTDGSGILQYPDIVYNSANDLFFLTMVDPLAESYNNEMAFIAGDIANAEDANWYGISGTTSENYNYAAGASTANYFISLTTEDGYDMVQTFGFGYFTSPDFEHPPVMGGFYYDGQSEHQSCPSAELEMDTNSNRIFIVCETEDQITIKSTVNDEALLTNGEMQNGMDKYADVEQFPGEYLGVGSDPDVSGSGSNVCVVYEQGGDVKCSYSSCDAGTYDPGFDWGVSTVATGANYPAVFMQGSTVYCAYVQNGNLFLKISEDAGATWGAAEQKNEEDGTVVGEKGTVDVGKNGIVWTDERNGNYDIYFASLAGAFPEVIVESVTGGIGITATLKNVGDAPAENFDWSIVSDGLVFIGGKKSGQETLAPGETVQVKTGLMLGFGDIAVTVTADQATKNVDAKLLLLFVTGL